MKHLVWMLLVLLLAAAVAQAQPRYGYGRPAPYDMMQRERPAEQALELVRDGVEKLIPFLKQEERPNQLQVAAFLDREIAPYFDFDFMARGVAGPKYANMTPAKRTALAKKLEARFLSALARHLTKYEDQKVRYFRPRHARSNAVTVSLGILRPGKYPSKMEFRMRRSSSSDDWKVVDVVSNGRSAIAYYRERLRASSRPSPGQYAR